MIMATRTLRVVVWVLILIVSFNSICMFIINTLPILISPIVCMFVAVVYSVFNYLIGHKIISYCFIFICAGIGIDFLI